MGFPIYSPYSYCIHPIGKAGRLYNLLRRRVRLCIILLLGLFVIFAFTGCMKSQCELNITVEPSSPYVNQIVHFTGNVVPTGEAANILDWQWSFGDGQIASGQEAWHQYRSYDTSADGYVIPWVVKLTATHVDGTKYVAVKEVTLHSEAECSLAGYYLRHVTTGCTNISSSRPQPSGQELEYVQEDVLNGWWLVSSSESFYLLAELHFLPDSVDQARCIWTLYSRGESRRGAPRLVKILLSDVRAVQHNAQYFYNVGFPLQVLPNNEFSASGWYQIIAEVSSLDGEYRTYIDFMLNVDY